MTVSEGSACFVSPRSHCPASASSSAFGCVVSSLVVDYSQVILTAVFNGVIFLKYPDYEKSCRIVDLVRRTFLVANSLQGEA